MRTVTDPPMYAETARHFGVNLARQCIQGADLYESPYVRSLQNRAGDDDSVRLVVDALLTHGERLTTYDAIWALVDELEPQTPRGSVGNDLLQGLELGGEQYGRPGT